MAKRSEIEAKMAALQKELDAADPDEEVWVRSESGHEVKLTGKRAASVLSKFGGLFDSDNEKGDDDQGDEDEGEEDDKGAAGYFRRKR